MSYSIEINHLDGNEQRVHIKRNIKSMRGLKKAIEDAIQELTDENEGQIVKWSIITENENDVIIIGITGIPANAFCTEDISNYDRAETEEYLDELSMESDIEAGEQIAVQAVIDAKLYPHHKLYSLPDTNDKFESALDAAIEELTREYPDETIVWDMHQSCTLPCPCFIIGIPKKKILHINTYFIDESDRAECQVICAKKQTTTHVERLYKDA